MNWILRDRRQQRSSNSNKALQLQLSSTKKNEKLEAVALADESGMLVCHDGELNTCLELAALGPLLPGSVFGMPLPPNLMGGKIEVQPFSLDGEKLFLVYFTSKTNLCFEDSLLESSRGIQRILSTN